MVVVVVAAAVIVADPPQHSTEQFVIHGLGEDLHKFYMMTRASFLLVSHQCPFRHQRERERGPFALVLIANTQREFDAILRRKCQKPQKELQIC